MRATAVPVDGNKVRLSVEVDESEIDEAVDATAKRLTRQLRVPGFRPGRVPRPVLEARLGGAAALRQQAISDALPDLYARAISDSDLDPIAAPEIDVVSGEDSGPLTFDAVVEVRPTVSVPGYQGLVVTVPSVEVSEEEVDEQVDRLRRQSGELNAVTRPARKGDHVTIDLHAVSSGRDDLDVEDYLYEVGSGSDIPGLDEQLTGAKQGDIFKFSAPLPGPTSADTSDAEIRVLVKEVKEMILPEPTDEWASEMSEFETIEELREERRTALERVKVARAQMTLREGALEALVALVADEPPESLVEEEVRERVHDLGHRLEARRVTLDQFLEVSGRSREELTAELRAEAVRDVRADLALRALADAEDLEVTDEELDQAVREIADEASSSYEEIRARLDRSGRLSAVRSGRRKAKALSWLLEHVELMDDDGKPVSRDDLRGSSAAEETTASIEVGTETGPASTDTVTAGELGSEDVGVEEEAAQEAGT
ncbi:MAG: trigger factor [Acidimicrobiales bacterium]